VHYLSDVAGALVIGTAWLLAMTTAFSAWRRDLNRLSVPQDPELEPANPE
jgi:membrane-associated phospholipid phosphatase